MLTTLATRNRGPHLDRCPPVPLVTNLFKVDFKDDTRIYIYAVRTEPKIALDNNKKLRVMLINSRKIIQRLIGTHVQTGRVVFGTKGQYCSIGEEINFNVQFEGQTHHIFLKLVKAVIMKDLQSPDKRRSGVVFGFLSSIVKNFFNQIGYSQIGRTGKYFDPRHVAKIESANVYVNKGYSSNFSLLEAGLFLRIDVAVKVVRNETALQIINRIYSMYPNHSKSEKRRMVENELVGKMVMSNYVKCAYYTIESVLFDIPLDKYFFFANNTEVNIVDYYQKTYGITISLKQPLLKAIYGRNRKHKKEAQIILVPELMLMGGFPKNFDERKRRQVSEQTIIHPAQRFKQILSALNSFNEISDDFNPKMVADKLGITIDTASTKIVGKQLKIPELRLGRRDRIDENKSTNFMLFDKPLFSPDVPLLISIFCPLQMDLSAIKELMHSTCNKLGLHYEFIAKEIKFADPKITLRILKEHIQRQCTSTQGCPNIFWIIIPNSFKFYYGAIKKIVLQAGIDKNSQITIEWTLQRKNVISIFTRILLQMAAKVGNKLWVPRLPSRIPDVGVMMIGLEKSKVPSDPNTTMITYSCNSDRQCSQFYSNYIIHNKKEDFKTHLNEIVFTCLTEYARCNGQAPSDIILIKNGSSGHDNSTVIEGQVIEIKDVLSAWKSPNRINLVYLLLEKDTNQKFFVERGRDIVNPQSGILVNRQVVGKQFEFYLIAQQSVRGSVRPTFYKAVFSNSSLEEGIIQELLFGQCFNYMNWSGSIKIPAVMQYAKKLSIFLGQLQGEQRVGEVLSRYLYYI